MRFPKLHPACCTPVFCVTSRESGAQFSKDWRFRRLAHRWIQLGFCCPLAAWVVEDGPRLSHGRAWHFLAGLGSHCKVGRAGPAFSVLGSVGAAVLAAA